MVALARRPDQAPHPGFLADAADARIPFLRNLREDVVVVEAEPVDQLFAEFDAAHRVSPRVDPRGPEGQAHHVGDDDDHRSTHAALGREPHREGELARIVVHPAGDHEREAVLHILGAKHPIAGDRADASVGEGCGQHRHHLDVELDRAGLEVELEGVEHLGVFGKGTVLAHVVAECEVPIGGVAFGLIDRVVEVHFLFSAEGGPDLEECIKTPRDVEIGPNHRGADDGPGVDHRVVGFAVLAQCELVEIEAARLTADKAVDVVFAVLLEGRAIGNRFAARLHTELTASVAQRVALPEHRTQGHPVFVRFDTRELWDVVRDGAVPVLPRRGEDAVDLGGEVGEVGDRRAPLECALDEEDVGPDRVGEGLRRETISAPEARQALAEICQTQVVVAQPLFRERVEKVPDHHRALVFEIEGPKQAEFTRIERHRAAGRVVHPVALAHRVLRGTPWYSGRASLG